MISQLDTILPAELAPPMLDQQQFSDLQVDAPIDDPWAMLGGMALSQEEYETQIGPLDELFEMAASQPDNEIARAIIGDLVTIAFERGDIERVMAAAMQAGALACTHGHMESLASDLGSLLKGLAEPQGAEAHASKSSGSHDDHEGHDDQEVHDKSRCKLCRKGMPCPEA